MHIALIYTKYIFRSFLSHLSRKLYIILRLRGVELRYQLVDVGPSYTQLSLIIYKSAFTKQ